MTLLETFGIPIGLGIVGVALGIWLSFLRAERARKELADRVERKRQEDMKTIRTLSAQRRALMGSETTTEPSKRNGS